MNASNHPLYWTWAAMIQRCDNPNDSGFHCYGGRGIRVCPRWQESFWHFVADMGPKPTPAHQLDRYPNNNGHYEPGNCRWATRSANIRNSRKAARVTFQGRTQCIAAWAIEYGLNQTTLSARLFRSNWTAERALTTPVRPK